MLKIKDNIDLKELEKFGFKYEEEHGLHSNRYIYIDEDNSQTVALNTKDREIFVEDTSESYTFGAIVDDALTVIYDLIQAGLVEKVREQDE